MALALLGNPAKKSVVEAIYKVINEGPDPKAIDLMRTFLIDNFHTTHDVFLLMDRDKMHAIDHVKSVTGVTYAQQNKALVILIDKEAQVPVWLQATRMAASHLGAHTCVPIYIKEDGSVSRVIDATGGWLLAGFECTFSDDTFHTGSQDEVLKRLEADPRISQKMRDAYVRAMKASE